MKLETLPRFQRVCVRALVLSLALLIAPQVGAWGWEGHQIVATLAQQQLQPGVAAQVQRLLALEQRHSLAQIASWPDEIQDDPSQAALWQATRRQHYVDFRRSDACHYQPQADCPNGQCIVAGIAHYVAILADPQQGDAQRLEALKFVVHFVGDVHQPLHADYRDDDKGGNAYQVQFNRHGTNLHSVWDSGLIKLREEDVATYAARLAASYPLHAERPTPASYAGWAEESCRISRDDGIYPHGHVIPATYVAAAQKIIDLRLVQAGARLAQVLNQALAAPAPIAP